MSEIKLLPCPFCGGEAEYTEKGNEYIGISETVIKCKKCHTRQVHKWLKFKFDFEHIRELTVKAWNTRKPMERIIERLEEERKYSYENFKDEERAWRKGLRTAIKIVKEEGGIE